jgi:hypothetical protein
VGLLWGVGTHASFLHTPICILPKGPINTDNGNALDEPQMLWNMSGRLATNNPFRQIVG